MVIQISSFIMVLPYQWILENIEEEPKTLSSKIILFRGEEVFRVALKNTVEKQTLIFVAIALNKIGMKVREVFYSNQNLEYFMEPLKKQNEDDSTLQVFSIDLKTRVSGKTTFNFYIQIGGSASDFSYQLADRLLKNQLWMAVKKLQWTDIDFIVKGKKISAHKCVLAARSPIFETRFANDKTVGNNVITIDDVDVSTFEQFLHFLYTGEINKSLDNEQLLKLANDFELTTLKMLCENAAKKICFQELTLPLISFNPRSETVSSFEIEPMKDTELYFDPNTSTFLVDWSFNVEDNATVKQEFLEYQNEKLFSVHVTGVESRTANLSTNGYPTTSYHLESPTVHLICANHRNRYCQLVEAVCSFKGLNKWTKMEQRNVQEKGLILTYSAQFARYKLIPGLKYIITFRIKIASVIDNYHHEMMDSKYSIQLWNAATNRQMTDVEISVGSKKFEAHRVVLAARSPVFDAQLNKDKNIVKSSITICATVDSTTFQHFLEFLYTGTLKISADNKQLLALAKMYEVETLKKLCRNANQEFGVDELTSCFLAAL